MQLIIITFCILPFIISIPDPNFKICKSHFASGIPPQSKAPHPETTVSLCRNNFLAISYNTYLRSPLWAAYKITSEQIKKCQGGRRKFSYDPDLLANHLNQADPDSPAFDATWTRGHLAPSRAFSWDKGINGSHMQVYYMSNIALQHARFNNIHWNALESHAFNWLKEKDSGEVYVITGVGFIKEKEISWRNEIAIPDYFYKMICDLRSNSSVAFYGNNNQNGTGVFEFRSIHEVEQIVSVKSNFPSSCNPSSVDTKAWWNWSHVEM